MRSNGIVRAENSPLDLNNLPEDFTRDVSKPAFDAGSSSSAERETEAMNRARQMVFGGDHNLAAVPHLGCSPALPGLGDPSLPFRSVYQPPRLYPGATSTLEPHQPHYLPQQPPPPPPQSAYIYPTSSRLYPSQFHHSSIPHRPVNDYYRGHVLSSATNGSYNYGSGGGPESNYTCIGAPVQDPPLSMNWFQDHGF
ncbi:hypothetical protein SAY87_025103 [Trapa incisa]|uniref:Uncharacterized protein n=1 Tax=Trapa incisa TaxID=236973 RepID=A0AAN7GAE7_9MYRT|nr:hypothetical protein SAY87_025103 [Trapa incisa]